MLAVCCAVVITTFIIDIIKHRTLGYRPEMVAMIIALVLVLIEAASVYFVVTMSGFFIGTGLIVNFVCQYNSHNKKNQRDRIQAPEGRK